MGAPVIGIRLATGTDAPALADLYLRARRAAVPAVPPLAHDADDVRGWMARVVAAGDTWVAAYGAGRLCGLMVLADDWVEQLYLDPDVTGRGIGTTLLEMAKERRPAGLQLWTFESNVRAQRFYVRHGFVAVEHTDGSGNEEQAPDVRFVWRGASTV